MTKKYLVVGITLAALFAATTPMMVSAVGDFLGINKAIIQVDNHFKGIAFLVLANGLIPQNGGIAAGYGVLTSTDSTRQSSCEGECTVNALVVVTSHAGVLDSELQNGDANNPVWHSHYVALGTPTDPGCTEIGADFQVTDISFSSPGQVKVNNNVIGLWKAPMTDGTFLVGPPSGQVVSFTLTPIGLENGNAQAVCISVHQIADAKLISN
ncbi:MAG: hypothetical protein HY223_03675 [Thaumarchaeota archaeon]|nr:hypothetical protein [Nitrososphaerota archaeon]